MAIAQESLTQKEAARRLGTTAHKLRSRTDVPRNKDGSYPWPAVSWAVLNESITQGELASRLTISTAWIRELTRRGILTRAADGAYLWPQNQDEYEDFRQDSDEVEDDSKGETYQAALARLTREKADAAEMENRLRRGELVELSRVDAMISAPLDAINTKLRTAKRRLGKRFAAKLGVSQAQAMALIQELVEDVRADIREVFEK